MVLRDKILSTVSNNPGISFDELCSKVRKSSKESCDDISSELHLLVRESKLHEVVFKDEKLYYITGSSKKVESSVSSSDSSGASASLGIGTLFLAVIAMAAVIYFFCFTDLGFYLLYGFVLLMIIIGILVVVFK